DRWHRTRRQVEREQRAGPAVSDRLAPTRSARWPAALQRSRPDAEIAFGGKVSWRRPLFSLFQKKSTANTAPAQFFGLANDRFGSWSCENLNAHAGDGIFQRDCASRESNHARTWRLDSDEENFIFGVSLKNAFSHSQGQTRQSQQPPR